mmetsp:Transcript_56710/g.113603  ORF Transcript_56710/g.113603 Transcript_56710/m.113603 type:complete len:202 (+) Transcript_56710:375-980(+)
MTISSSPGLRTPQLAGGEHQSAVPLLTLLPAPTAVPAQATPAAAVAVVTTVRLPRRVLARACSDCSDGGEGPGSEGSKNFRLDAKNTAVDDSRWAGVMEDDRETSSPASPPPPPAFELNPAEETDTTELLAELIESVVEPRLPPPRAPPAAPPCIPNRKSADAVSNTKRPRSVQGANDGAPTHHHPRRSTVHSNLSARFAI